jgi:hypothetical protein
MENESGRKPLALTATEPKNMEYPHAKWKRLDNATLCYAISLLFRRKRIIFVASKASRAIVI